MLPTHSAEAPVCPRFLAVPRPGRSLFAMTERYAVHARSAVLHIADALRPNDLDATYNDLFAPRYCLAKTASKASSSNSSSDLPIRAAWALVNLHIAARAAGALAPRGSLSEAEEWFLGPLRSELPSLAAHLPHTVAADAIAELSKIPIDDEFAGLLPYILEPHGPGTRLSVMRDPSTRTAREAKRRQGVFYTPADVAHYMAETVLASHATDATQARCLDPSCGTGVFLVALLHSAQRIAPRGFTKLGYAVQCLYGFDVSDLAVDSCAFVLLHECLDDVSSRRLIPWAAWQLLRLNLASEDAARVVPGHPPRFESELALSRSGIRDDLFQNSIPQSFSVDPKPQRPQAISDWRLPEWAMPLPYLFPEAAVGFDSVIGNPPYSDIPPNASWGFLRAEFASLQEHHPTQQPNWYPLFIEMMWRLTRPGRNSSALVVPLSIAYHQGNQYTLCRAAMAEHGGRWRCAFFDREPHALFGEEVKTRNAILFRLEGEATPPRGQSAELETTPLIKWTSRTRDRLFSSLHFTALGPVPFRAGLPKLAGSTQAEAYRLLVRRADALTTFVRAIRTSPLEQVETAVERPSVYVGNTAYNFLNVFRCLPSGFKEAGNLSESRLLCLELPSDDLADLTFAILSSRLVFWLWRVEGDGFHVSRSFLERIPFGRSSFSKAATTLLRVTGRRLWETIRRDVVVSVNGGRRSIAFRPFGSEAERDVIDSALIDAANLPTTFLQVLDEFVRHTVVVDPTDRTRRHLNHLFRM